MTTTTPISDADYLTIDALSALQQIRENDINNLLKDGEDGKTWLSEQLNQIKQEVERLQQLLK
jgi:hypothetical protein